VNRAETPQEAKKSARRMMRPRGCWVWRLRLIAIFLGAAFVAMGAQSPSEYEVKAAFLFNFAKFVEWPAGTFATADGPFRICVLGRDPFGANLDQIIAGKTLDGRRIVVARSADATKARTCQILFIASSETRRIPQILQQLNSAGVLTVGDSKGFAQMGGMINFVLDDDRVRFEINLKAADSAHLKLSARLMAVAKQVLGQDEDGTIPPRP
jgi:hypothetical protein